MAFHIDFTCKHMRQIPEETRPIYYKWRCNKRESAFRSIDTHCYDCPQYKIFLKEIKRFLEEG